MNNDRLSEYFTGAAAKVLHATEVDPETSRGHEYQGVNSFRTFLGSPAEKMTIPVTYAWLTDDEPPLKAELSGTWYNSRKNQPHREPEYRLYYPSVAEEVVYKARPGDTLLFCLPKSGPLLALSCPAGSTVERQLLWLFGLSKTDDFEGSQRDLREDLGKELDYTARYILDLIEVEVPASADEWLDKLVAEFGADTFPSTAAFSKFARENLKDIDPIKDADTCLLSWLDFEERLFRTLERSVVSKRLERGFFRGGIADVDGFVSFSLSVQNRRKARAGASLENHLEAIFKANHITYSRGAVTENKNKPDFLFPGVGQYRDPKFPSTNLTMLAAKSTCKDRWRQALSEAERIDTKHLITLEPGISENQTDEMKSKKLRLVLPVGLHETYRDSQRPWLIDVTGFIALVRERQN